MITIRTPFRISMGGGGTDIPSYYEQYGGHIITAAINKYMYVSINESKTCNKIKLYYDKVEIVYDLNDIQHDIIRESLKLFDIKKPLEIASMADIEAGTGMGSSSSFTVALLAGLNILARKNISVHQLAEGACHVEINGAGKKIGKQDQYIAAYGGIQEMDIVKNGMVTMESLPLKKDFISELEYRIVLFYTAIRRPAGLILDKQSDDMRKDHGLAIKTMSRIKELGYEVKEALLSEDIDTLGRIFDTHWNEKKKVSKKMSGDNIDSWYNLGLTSGAIGGKVVGAGGGGFIMFVCKEGKKKDLIRTMELAGLRYMDFRFDFDGVKVIQNI